VTDLRFERLLHILRRPAHSARAFPWAQSVLGNQAKMVPRQPVNIWLDPPDPRPALGTSAAVAQSSGRLIRGRSDHA